MIDLPMEDFRGRVLLSRERVRFADADPYGHLASGAYVNMIMSHRVEALEDLLGFSIMRHARSGVAFPARSVEIEYLRPASRSRWGVGSRNSGPRASRCARWSSGIPIARSAPCAGSTL